MRQPSEQGQPVSKIHIFMDTITNSFKLLFTADDAETTGDYEYILAKYQSDPF